MSYLRTFQTAAFIGAMGCFSGAFAQATSPGTTSQCESINASIASGLCNASCQASFFSLHPECAPSNNSTVSTQAVQATSIYQALAISSQISTALTTLFTTGPARFGSNAAQTGMAAGSAPPRSNAWVNLSRNDIDYTRAGSQFDSEVDNVIVGYDLRLRPNLIVGVSAAFDNGDANIRFANASIDTRGWAIAPYVGYQYNQNLTFDASIGLGQGKIETRTNALSGTTDSDRYFAAANANYAVWAGNIQWLARATYLDASEKKEAFSLGATNIAERKDSLSQVRLGGQVGYWLNGVMPYASLMYSNDVRRTRDQTTGAPQIEKDAWLAGIGVNLFNRQGYMWGSLSYTAEFGRDDMKNRVLLANFSYRF